MMCKHENLIAVKKIQPVWILIDENTDEWIKSVQETSELVCEDCNIVLPLKAIKVEELADSYVTIDEWRCIENA